MVPALAVMGGGDRRGDDRRLRLGGCSDVSGGDDDMLAVAGYSSGMIGKQYTDDLTGTPLRTDLVHAAIDKGQKRAVGCGDQRWDAVVAARKAGIELAEEILRVDGRREGGDG